MRLGGGSFGWVGRVYPTVTLSADTRVIGMVGHACELN